MVKAAHRPVLIVIAGPNGSGKGGHDVPIPKIISRYQKSILNCKRVAAIADRVYVYDNSVDDAEARLLFRMTDGLLFKRYTDDIPLWAQAIID
ncbi:MAG: hypothetical protein IJP46_07575 [Prevotella sp.]|nr:hypothetical protein [Prevotella sp.]